MRKFLMAAALLAVAACGEKKPNPASDTGAMAPAAMPTTVGDSAKKADSLKADSTRKADSMKNMAPADTTKMAKPPVKKP
jgi:hypothetical protein